MVDVLVGQYGCSMSDEEGNGRRDRPLLLGELDKKVQAYVRALRDAGGSIGSSIVIADAEGIVTAHDRTLLVQYGGHINLTRDWSLSLLSRM